MALHKVFQDPDFDENLTREVGSPKYYDDDMHRGDHGEDDDDNEDDDNANVIEVSTLDCC